MHESGVNVTFSAHVNAALPLARVCIHQLTERQEENFQPTHL